MAETLISRVFFPLPNQSLLSYRIHSECKCRRRLWWEPVQCPGLECSCGACVISPLFVFSRLHQDANTGALLESCSDLMLSWSLGWWGCCLNLQLCAESYTDLIGKDLRGQLLTSHLAFDLTVVLGSFWFCSFFKIVLCECFREGVI